MQKRGRLLAFVLSLMLLMTCIPLKASANSPAPGPSYTFYIENYPEETVYVDLLIYLPETDPQYQEFAEKKIPDGFSGTAGIIAYCEEDYRSYTFHYQGAKSRIRLRNDGSVTFFEDGSTIYDESIAYGHQEEIEGRGKIRLALLDAQGNILQVSKPHSLKPKGLFSYSLGVFHYDAAQDTMQVESHSNGLVALIFGVASVIGLALSCFTEWMVALAFNGVKAYSRLVVWTNLVSQILMRGLEIVLLGLMMMSGVLYAYFVTVVILEILVYTGEFLFYRVKMHGVSTRRCLAYTVCANTASLIVGLLVLSIVL